LVYVAHFILELVETLLAPRSEYTGPARVNAERERERERERDTHTRKAQ